MITPFDFENHFPKENDFDECAWTKQFVESEQKVLNPILSEIRKLEQESIGLRKSKTNAELQFQNSSLFVEYFKTGQVLRKINKRINSNQKELSKLYKKRHLAIQPYEERI